MKQRWGNLKEEIFLSKEEASLGVGWCLFIDDWPSESSLVIQKVKCSAPGKSEQKGEHLKDTDILARQKFPSPLPPIRAVNSKLE